MEIFLWCVVGFVILIIIGAFLASCANEFDVKRIEPNPISYQNMIAAHPYYRDFFRGGHSMYDECFYRCGGRGFHMCSGKKEEKKMEMKAISIEDLIENNACKDGMLWFLKRFGKFNNTYVEDVKRKALEDGHSSYAVWLSKTFPGKNYFDFSTESIGSYDSNWHYGRLVVAKNDFPVAQGWVKAGTYGIFLKADNTWKHVVFIGDKMELTVAFHPTSEPMAVHPDSMSLVYPGITYLKVRGGWVINK